MHSANETAVVALTDEMAGTDAEDGRDAPQPLVRLWFAAVGFVAAAGIAARIGADVDLIAAVAFVAVATAIAIIDVERFRVPNRLVLPATAAALVWQAVFHHGDFLACLIWGAGAGLFFLVAFVISRGAVGMGDVKFALLMGLVLAQDVITGVFVGTLAGGVAGAVVLWRQGKEGRKTAIPYAPFLAAGALVALLVGASSPLVS
jgi:leader peptidase (prepilin peptidase) / N-methyltransferase